MRLVFLPLPSKPGEHVGIHAKAHQLLDGPVETSNLDVRLRIPRDADQRSELMSITIPK
jgi:hypothetical protein